MGSFITVFAKHFVVALPSSAVLAGHALLDIRKMENNYKWLVHHGDKNYEWFVKGEGQDANEVLYARLPFVEPSAETDDLFAYQAYVPRNQSTLLGPAHPYSRMSRFEVFDPHTSPLALITTREFRIFMDRFASFSQNVIAQFDALERKVTYLGSKVVSLRQQLEASGLTVLLLTLSPRLLLSHPPKPMTFLLTKLMCQGIKVLF
ncbi:Heat-inducible transcription repressor HrcA [Bienertia sinuspersici]